MAIKKEYRDIVRKLYIEDGLTASEIQRYLQNDLDMKVSLFAIYSWIDKGGWEVDRRIIDQRAKEQLVDKAVEKRIKKLEDQLQEIDQIKGRAIEAISDEGISYKSLEGASTVALKAIAEEREIISDIGQVKGGDEIEKIRSLFAIMTDDTKIRIEAILEKIARTVEIKKSD